MFFYYMPKLNHKVINTHQKCRLGSYIYIKLFLADQALYNPA